MYKFVSMQVSNCLFVHKQRRMYVQYKWLVWVSLELTQDSMIVYLVKFRAVCAGHSSLSTIQHEDIQQPHLFCGIQTSA